MTNFTKEELYEIEKVFDNITSNHTVMFAEIVCKLQKYHNEVKVKELLDKLFTDSVDCFNLYRTISAKAKLLREE